MPVVTVSHIMGLRDLVSRSKPVIHPPVRHSAFTLDSSGVAGFFGGEGAVCAMSTVHLLPFRFLGGWYNSPGSYEIAKQYGQIANSPFWNGLFPGSEREPAELFGLDGKGGPRRYLGAHSGTSLPTGHAAFLLSRRVQNLASIPLAESAAKSTPVHVTVIHLRDNPEDGVETVLDATRSTVEPFALRYSGFLAIIPISVSIGACIVCALIADWYCFACIALGILAGGVACFVIGSGKLVFHHPRSTQYAPVGDGVMWEGTEMIVLLGSESAVNVFTRGGFSLRFGDGSKHRLVGWCSVLLTLQFLVQLLFIPQGQLFGQIMFFISLVVSWLYNIFISSFDKAELQMNLLLRQVMPKLKEDMAHEKIRRFELPSWRTGVVLALLVLQNEASVPEPQSKPESLNGPHSGSVRLSDRLSNPRRVLDELLPNDTLVWQQWKRRVIELSIGAPTSEEDDSVVAAFQGNDRNLYDQIFSDAQIVYDSYLKTKTNDLTPPDPTAPTPLAFSSSTPSTKTDDCMS